MSSTGGEIGSTLGAVTFGFRKDHSDSDWFQATICDLPWVTSISKSFLGQVPPYPASTVISTNNDLITFAKEIRLKLNPRSTYIFTDVTGLGFYKDLGGLEGRGHARILISFVADDEQSLVLRLKHTGTGSEDMPLEVTLGPTKIQLNPSSKSLLTIDDITLYPIHDPRPSESDYPGIPFEPGVRNDIIINFRTTAKSEEEELERIITEGLGHRHFLQDIELLSESGHLDYLKNGRPYSALI